MIPKFRVWDKKNNRFLVADIAIDGLGNLMLYDPDEYGGYFDKIDEAELQNYEVSLSTGQKDHAGNEIYEGDILGFDEGPDNRAIEFRKQTAFWRVEVCFDEWSCGDDCEYECSGRGWCIRGFHGYYRTDGRISRYEMENSINGLDVRGVILGNRFENPELLQGEN